MTWKLLASAPTLDAIAECIARFYGGEHKEWASDPETGVISLYQPTTKRKLERVRVIVKRGRYRFEMQA